MLARLPLRFEANRGQWSREVLYGARTAAGSRNLFLTARGPVLANFGRDRESSKRVELRLTGSNPRPRVEPLDKFAAHTDYFIGTRSEWHTKVAQYARVAYRSVYPGIDVVYYGGKDQLEYDFQLRPGADPNAIRLKFRGADRVSLNAAGDLVVECGGFEFVQKRPVLYEENARTLERRPVEGRYRLLADGVAAFEVGAYNHSQTLVIDPVIYSSFLGGTATDQINAVTTDANGYIYVAGYTDSTQDLNPTYNGVQGTDAGENDAFIAVFNPTVSGVPSLRYLTYLGGSNDDAATAITVDSSGNLYVAGTTSSMNFPVAGNAVQTALTLSTSETAFNPDLFIAVISQSSGLVYSTYYGGSGGDFPYGIGLDANGNIYVGGTTQSTDFPITPNAYAAVLWGPSDVFVLELNINDTAAIYASFIGGENQDDGRGFAVTPDGKVYLAASTLSTLFPLAGQAYQTTLNGIENLVVIEMDLTKSGNSSLVYATYLGGTNLDEVRQLTIDASTGHLLLTGWTLSPDFPVTATAFRPTYGGQGNAFVARVNPAAPPSGFLEYSTFLGGSGGDVGYSVTSDAAGNYYVAGYTLSTDFPVTPDAGESQYLGGTEAFLVEFNPTVAGAGALEYGSYFGGGGIHVATGVAVAPNGTMLIGGYTTDALSGVGKSIEGAYQQGFGGGISDGFVIAVQPDAASDPDSTDVRGLPPVSGHAPRHPL